MEFKTMGQGGKRISIANNVYRKCLNFTDKPELANKYTNKPYTFETNNFNKPIIIYYHVCLYVFGTEGIPHQMMVLPYWMIIRPKLTHYWI